MIIMHIIFTPFSLTAAAPFITTYTYICIRIIMYDTRLKQTVQRYRRPTPPAHNHDDVVSVTVIILYYVCISSLLRLPITGVRML